nr:putative ribonuclease p/mrp protein subunit pop5 [Quercus suber]
MNPITKLCIIRASREEYQKVWSAITMVRSIGNCPVLFNLLDLSGSIKACRNVALYVKTETSSEHDAKVEDKLQVVPSTKTKAQMVLAEMKRTAQTIT